MFQFGWFPTYTYEFSICYMDITPCGLPHSDICGFNAYLPLPAAFRSLSRPSSAPSAKAFPLRSSSLDFFELCRQLCLFHEHVTPRCALSASSSAPCAWRTLRKIALRFENKFRRANFQTRAARQLVFRTTKIVIITLLEFFG